jgi:putative membrane protein
MTAYLILKALHIISMVAWMAGLFYLPRLFVYHVDAPRGSDKDKTFTVMEGKLLRIIMLPAKILTFVFGIGMIALNPDIMRGAGWLHAKIMLVVLLAAYHGYLIGCYKKFARGENKKSGRFYRMLNEVPTILLICIVFLAVLRPF